MSLLPKIEFLLLYHTNNGFLIESDSNLIYSFNQDVSGLVNKSGNTGLAVVVVYCTSKTSCNSVFPLYIQRFSFSLTSWIVTVILNLVPFSISVLVREVILISPVLSISPIEAKDLVNKDSFTLTPVEVNNSYLKVIVY